MTAPVASAATVADLVGNMEEDVGELVAWADAITCVGCSSVVFQPETVFVMGKAMTEVAERLRDTWRELHGLAVPGSTLAKGKPCT